MNETSATASDTASGSVSRSGASGSRRAAWVRSMETTRAIAAQRLRQLSAAHVESIDAARAALQQAVGEAAGRGAHVQADATRRRPPRTRRGRRRASHRRATRTAAAPAAPARCPGPPGRRACGRAGRRRPRPTRTRPASSSAWARAARGRQPPFDEQLVQASPVRAGPVRRSRASRWAAAISGVMPRSSDRPPATCSRMPATSRRTWRAQVGHRAVVHEPVRRGCRCAAPGCRAGPASTRPAVRDRLQDRRPEAAGERALLERDESRLPRAAPRMQLPCRAAWRSGR